MAAFGQQRNRNVKKRTHCIVVDQDSLTAPTCPKLSGVGGGNQWGSP